MESPILDWSGIDLACHLLGHRRSAFAASQEIMIMATVTATATSTHIESLLSKEEQASFDSILSSAIGVATATESASAAWASFLTGLVIEHGTREAACRLGTAIAKAKTLTIRTTEGGDKAIDAAMASCDLATNWARKVLRNEYRYALKLSKPKRNKVLAGGDEYRLMAVEVVEEGRGHVVTPTVPTAAPEAAAPESTDGMVLVDPKDLDALLNLAVSVHDLEAVTFAVIRRLGASPEVASTMAKSLPESIRKIAKGGKIRASA